MTDTMAEMQERIDRLYAKVAASHEAEIFPCNMRWEEQVHEMLREAQWLEYQLDLAEEAAAAVAPQD